MELTLCGRAYLAEVQRHVDAVVQHSLVENGLALAKTLIDERRS
jgi:hypothetical protein